jgi:hypothetical protein
VKLTDSGEVLIAEVFPRFNREEQRVAGLLTAEQREAMDDGLRRILRELGAQFPGIRSTTSTMAAVRLSAVPRRDTGPARGRCRR